MNLADLLSNPQVLNQLANSVGARPDQAQAGLEALLPSVTRAMQRNAGGGSGLEALAGALGSGRHDRYVDSPDLLGRPETRVDGNNILGHIFGSKDVSRNVAAHASQQSGVSSDLLKQMLPLVASLAMGALSKGSQGGRSIQQPQGGGGMDVLGGLLGGLLGGGAAQQQANDSPLDDILDLAKKFL